MNPIRWIRVWWRRRQIRKRIEIQRRAVEAEQRRIAEEAQQFVAEVNAITTETKIVAIEAEGIQTPWLRPSRWRERVQAKKAERPSRYERLSDDE